MRKFYVCSALALATTACTPSDGSADKSDGLEEVAPTIVADAAILSSDGTPNGTVSLSMIDGKPNLIISLEGLESGEKAFHLHTTGVCEGPDFKSAGGHLNPFNKSHGSLSEGGQHLGDFANIEVTPNGTVDASRQIESDAAELLELIFDEDGTAVMIHAGPDDYASDPAGAAGPRVACGVLKKAT